MKVSINWLKDFVNIDSVDATTLAERITRSGIEVEGVEQLSGARNVVVGHVLKKEKHPESDKLSVCLVDLGNGETQQICCGAKNIEANQKVIVAKVGATLPGDIKIKEAVLRGVESNGMICSLEELGIQSKFIKDEFKDGIQVLDETTPIGVNALEYLAFDDTVLELSITPNRADALSMLGVGYEVAAILNEDLTIPLIEVKENQESIHDYLSVTVNTDLNPKYVARVVKNVEIKESPQFIQARLIASGIRPINNVVDITNYVMLELGQPLHAFDYDLLGNEIVVRMAQSEEEVVTLDGIQRQLKSSNIVITNGKEAVAVAGVMGCGNTEVSENTKNIVLESAYFDALTVRLASKELGLRSESSLRFEKGLDPERVEMAIDRAAQLLVMYANAEVVQGKIVHNILDVKEKTIAITHSKITSVLGMSIPSDDIVAIFERLGFDVVVTDETFTVTVPTRRLDITIQEDLIEEVGRIYGYDQLESKPLVATITQGKYSDSYLRRKRIRTFLEGMGMNQVITYSLMNQNKIRQFTTDTFDSIELAMPLSEERKVLRYSLIPSLLEVIAYNKARNLHDLSIFEIGTSYYQKDGKHHEELKLTFALTGLFNQTKYMQQKVTSDFYVAKGVVESLFNHLGLVNRYQFKKDDKMTTDLHPGRSAKIVVENKEVGIIGQVHPSLSKTPIYVVEISLDKIFQSKVRNIKCKEISKFPSMSRDLAFVVDRDVTAGDLMNTIKRAAGRSLISLDLFDVYQGENIESTKKSMAFALTYQDANQTLTDEEVTSSMKRVVEAVEKNHKGTLRG